MMNDIERQLREVEQPHPGRPHRERVLAAAMPLVQADDSVLDRVWFSPTWRVAAVLALAALAGAEFVSNGSVSMTVLAEQQSADSPAKTVATVARDLGLSSAEAAMLVAQVRTSNNGFEGVNR